jgi:UDP-sulfoquinovose synthase
MRVLILGADGYLGWPTVMYFSIRSHDVIAVDSYFRRKADIELDCESLIPCPNLLQRKRTWYAHTRKNIKVHIGDITDYGFLCKIFQIYRPDAVVHYAEQPSAPYSMIDREKAALTVQK